jgi:hypothetical protein
MSPQIDPKQRRALLRGIRAEIRIRKKFACVLDELPGGAKTALGDELRRLFRTDGAALKWLLTSAPALGGRTPLEVARTPDGLQEVLGVIKGIEHGNVM